MTCLIGTITAADIQQNDTTSVDINDNIVTNTHIRQDDTQNNIQINDKIYNNDIKSEKTATGNKLVKNEKNMKNALFNANLTISANPTSNLKVGDKVTIRSTMDNSMATSDLTLFVNNKNVTTFGGNAQTTYTLTQSGTNTIYALYPGDGGMLWDDIKLNTITLNVAGSGQDTTKYNSTIRLTANASKVNINESFSIYTQVTPANATGNISIYINNQAIGSYDVSRGGANMALPSDGEYDIYATYNGNNYYSNSTSNTITISVINPDSPINTTNNTNNTNSSSNQSDSKLDTQIIAEDMYMRVGSSIMMNFTLLDVNGRPISNQELYLTLDGKTDGPAITQQDGNVHLNFTNYDDESGMETGVYELTINYPGNTTYNPATKTVQLTIATRIYESNITLEANSTQLNYGESFTITPTVDPHFMLYPENSETWNETVILSVFKDGILNATYVAYPDYYWIFDGYEPGVYTFNATYNGSTIMYPSKSNVVTVIITGDVPVINGTASIDISASSTRVDIGESVTIRTPVTPNTATGNITLYCNGQPISTYTTTQAGGTLTLTDPGNYTFYATYNGDNNYNATTSKNITIEAIDPTQNTTTNDTNTTTNDTNTTTKLDTQIIAEDMYMRVGSSIMMNFTLLDANGQPIPNQELYITLDGKTDGPAITEQDGSVHLNFTNYDDESGMEQGDYPFTITYNGNDKYNPTIKTVTLTIAVRSWETTTTIKSNASQINYGESFTITPTVDPEFMLHPIDNSSYQEIVVLNVYKDGQYYANYSAHPREYWIFDGFLPGVYTFNATYKGSDILYPSNSNTITVTVIGDVPVINGTASIDITANSIKIEIGDSVTIRTPVTPNTATGNITLYCNGQPISTYTTNQAGGTLTLTEPGNYTFYATYNGDSNYNATTSNNITIEVIDSSIVQDKLELDTYIGIDTIKPGLNFGVLITPTPSNFTGKINVSYIDPTGKKHTTTIDYPTSNGVKLNLTQLGNYTFYSYVTDNPIYGTVYSNNVTLEVKEDKKYELEIELWPDVAKFARSTLIITKQSLKDATGNITYIVDGEDFCNFTANELLKNQPSFIFDKAGNITIQARYDGEDYGQVYSNKVIFEYLPLESIIEADDITVKQGENAIFTIRLIDEDGYVICVDEDDIPVGNQTIHIVINNQTYGPFKTNSDGESKFTFNTSTLKIGSYPVTIIYGGGVWDNLTVYDVEDGLYQDYGHKAANKTITLTVSGEKNTTIEAEDITMEVYDQKQLTITVKDEDGQINPNVTVKIDNKNYSITIKNNTAYVDLSTLEDGKYVVYITYNPDSTHKSSNKTVTIKVNRKKPTITLNNIGDNYVGDKINIKGKLLDSNNKTLANAQIIIKIKNNDKTVDEEINTTTNKNGEYDYTYTITKSGEYEVKAESIKNKTHDKAKAETTFISNKKTITIQVKTDKNTYNVGDKIIITPTTASDVTQNVTLNINGENIKIPANNAYQYTTTKEGTIKINATYPGDDKYNNVTASTITVKVNKQTPTITINKIDKTPVNTQVTIMGKLQNKNQSISNANVIVTINNVNQTVKTNKDGVYILNYTTNKLNTNNVTVTYNGDNKYNNVQNKTTFTVYNNTATITLKTDKKTYTIGESITVTPTVSPSDATGKVTLNINGLIMQVDVNKSFKYQTDNTGNITIKAKYNGDKTYKQTNEVTTNVVVNKIITKITLENTTDSKTNTSIIIKGKLTDINNKAIANEKITVEINKNQSIQTKTDKKGNFNVSYVSMEAKQNNITASFAGNNKYESSQNNTTDAVRKLTTKIAVNRIVGIIGENITLIANVTDENNNPVNGGKVIFKLNGLTLKTDGVFGSNADALTLKVVNGQVQFTLEAYLHLRRAQNVTAVYGGNSIYDSSRSATKKAQILLRNATVSVSTQDVARQNTNITFTAKISDITNNKTAAPRNNDDAYVFFKINGQTLRDENNDTLKTKVVNGVAQLNYTVPNGMGGITSQNHSKYKQYTVLAGYVNPDYYPNARANDSFIIERANISFNIKDLTFNNKTKKLSVKSDILTDTNINAKGQNVVIVKINGATYKNATTGKSQLYLIQDGKIDITLDLSQKINKIDNIELVTGERLVYSGARLKTSNIEVIN